MLRSLKIVAVCLIIFNLFENKSYVISYEITILLLHIISKHSALVLPLLSRPFCSFGRKILVSN